MAAAMYSRPMGIKSAAKPNPFRPLGLINKSRLNVVYHLHAVFLTSFQLGPDLRRYRFFPVFSCCTDVIYACFPSRVSNADVGVLLLLSSQPSQ